MNNTVIGAKRVSINQKTAPAILVYAGDACIVLSQENIAMRSIVHVERDNIPALITALMMVEKGKESEDE